MLREQRVYAILLSTWQAARADSKSELVREITQQRYRFHELPRPFPLAIRGHQDGPKDTLSKHAT